MRNILIIGGSSGIGKALANQLVTDNYHVFASYHQTIPDLPTDGIRFFEWDVMADNSALPELPEVIHGLVYCPGSIALKPFARIQKEVFMQDFQLNVLGAIQVIQFVLPKLKLAGDASIVLFSTVAVQLGLNFHSLVATSKGAIEGLTRALAAELAPTIRVNCIAPSLTDTPLSEALLNSVEKREANAQRHPLKKIGTADDIANMAKFLLSNQSAWITGQVLAVDGGMGSIK